MYDVHVYTHRYTIFLWFFHGVGTGFRAMVVFSSSENEEELNVKSTLVFLCLQRVCWGGGVGAKPGYGWRAQGGGGELDSHWERGSLKCVWGLGKGVRGRMVIENRTCQDEIRNKLSCRLLLRGNKAIKLLRASSSQLGARPE